MFFIQTFTSIFFETISQTNNSRVMKKIIIGTIMFIFLVPALMAQVDLTQLSLNIQEKYNQNFATMAQYTWQRNTQVFMKGELKATILANISVGSDGKPVANVIDQTSTTKKKPGVRGAVQSSEIDKTKTYVENALKLVVEYIFMSKGQMVDLFDKGTVSQLGNNLQVQGYNFITQGDNLQYLYNIESLECESQTVSTVMSGDPVKAQVTYKQLDGVNMVEKITLDLPAKGLNAVAVNSQWAKKL